MPVKHRKHSAAPDVGGPQSILVSDWNDTLVAEGGADGLPLVRKAAHADGMDFAATAAEARAPLDVYSTAEVDALIDTVEALPGPPGPEGPQGEPGPAGAEGAVGPAGAPGPPGAAGADGADSTVPGPAGPAGAAGPQGDPGPAGATGATGPAGADSTVPGPAGPAGADGADGATGPTGPEGPQGDTGATGAQGIQGIQGPAGTTGATGPGVVAGGTAGQVLTKINATDYNTQWTTPGTGGAPTAGSYVTIAAEASLSAERRLVVTAPVTLTDAGAGTTVTLALADDGVTDAKLRNAAALSVIGRATNTTGDPADIAAASDGQVLRRAGTALAFGAVDLGNANAVTGTLPTARGGMVAVPVTIANGGTAGTTAPLARTNLDVFSKGEIQGGVNLSPAPVLANNVFLGARETGGTARALIGLDGTNNAYVISDTPTNVSLGYSAATITLGSAVTPTNRVQIFGRLDNPFAVRAWAIVAADGTLYLGLNCTASKLGTGSYRITVTTTTGGTLVALATLWASNGLISVAGSTTTTVDVATKTPAAAAMDSYFAVLVLSL